MSPPQCSLQWSESELPMQLVSVSQLDYELDRIATATAQDLPTAVVLRLAHEEVHVLLGYSESFVYVDEPAASRYFITVGNPEAKGVIAFLLFGQHYTEFARRHLIPLASARGVVREFFKTTKR